MVVNDWSVRAAVVIVCITFGLPASAEEARVVVPTSPPIAAVNQSLDKLLRDAGALMKAGKASEAYAMLEPQESDYSGNIPFDYLFGVAALDSGKPDRATIAFERVLIMNPNFSGARLDLGRAYLAMGSDDLAEKEFKVVLSQDPPPHVKPVVEKFLESIAERRQAKLQQISSYIEFGVGRDSNITSATPDFTKGVKDVFNIAGVQATGSSLVRAATFGNLSGGLDISRVVDETNGIKLFAGIDLKRKAVSAMPQLDNSNIDLRAGVSKTSEADTYRLFINFGQYYQKGMTADVNSNRRTPAVGVEWKHNLGERDQLSLTGQYSRPRFEKMATQDTNQVMLSGSLIHIFEGDTSPLIFSNVSHTSDKAAVALDSGSDMSRKTTSVRLHFQLTPIAETDLFLSGGLSLRVDGSANARSALIPAIVGRDTTKDVSIGINWHPDPKWSIKTQVAKYNNTSNLSLYNYDRTESSLSIRRDF